MSNISVASVHSREQGSSVNAKFCCCVFLKIIKLQFELREKFEQRESGCHKVERNKVALSVFFLLQTPF